MKIRFFIVIAIAMTLLLGACNKDKEEDQEPAPEQEETAEIPELEEEDAEEVLQTYEETYQNVVENAEEDGELTDFDSLEEIEQELMTIMSQELADEFIDTYFEESEEGLIYIETSEDPIWFDEEESYELEKVEDDLYEVEQDQADNALIVTYSLSWDEEKWIVSEVETEEIPQEENDASNNESDAEANQPDSEDSADNGTADENASNDDTDAINEEEDNQASDNSGTGTSEQEQSNSNSNSNENANDSEASEVEPDSNAAEEDEETSEDTAGEINESEAENIVKQYLNITDDEFYVSTDHQDEDGNYVVQVYEVIEQGDSSHTSTYGWFVVNKETGDVEQMQ